MRKSCFRCLFHIKGYLLVIHGCVWMCMSLVIILLLSWLSLNELWCFPQGFTPSLLGLLVSQLIPWKLLLMSEGLELSGYVHLSIARFVDGSIYLLSFMSRNWYLYERIKYFALVLANFFLFSFLAISIT